MMLAVTVPQLTLNNIRDLEAKNCLCVLFAMQQTESSGATVNHIKNASSKGDCKSGFIKVDEI